MLTALEAAHGGLTQRLLSHNTIVYLGKISYGTYLWHWLVIIVITRTFHLSTLSTIAITTLVATALASLSYEILERPVRLSALLDTHRTTVIITGLAISAISALILIPNIVDPANATNPTLGTTTNTNIDTTGFTPVPSNLDWRHANEGADKNFVQCVDRPVDRCTDRARHRPTHPAHRRQPRRDARPDLHRHRRTRTPHPQRRHTRAAAPGNTTSTRFRSRSPVARCARKTASD